MTKLIQSGIVMVALLAVPVSLAMSGCAPARVRHVKTSPDQPLPDRSLAAHESVIEPAADSAAFPASETLTFDVRWAGVHIGTLTAMLNEQHDNGRDVYRIETHMKSNGLLAVLYRFADEYVSFVDRRTLKPLRHEVYSRHGSRRRGTITTFDSFSGTAVMKNLLDGSLKSFVIPANAHDLVSSLYQLQLLRFKPGDRITYEIFNIERYYFLTYLVSGTAMVYVPGLMPSAREAMVVEPYAYSREDGDVKRGRIKLYFFPQGNRSFPMYAEVDGPMFTKVTFTLSRIERAPGG